MACIAIVGPGAIGGVLAAWLGRTGAHEIVLGARHPFESLTVEIPDGPPLVSHPRVLTKPAEAPAVDWVLVTTKTYDAAGAAAWLPKLCAEGAPVAIVQNGVEHRERFAPFVDPSRLVPVIIDCPAERSAPGRIRQRGRGWLTVADDSPGRAFAALFEGTALELTPTGDFRSAAWRKLCLNSAGVISALLLQPSGVMRDAAVGEAALAIVREAMAVGRAEGAALPDDLAETVLAGYRNGAPDGVNSLHADRLAGRPLEIDARNGVIVRRGRHHGIPTPGNQLAVALLERMVADAGPSVAR